MRSLYSAASWRLGLLLAFFLIAANSVAAQCNDPLCSTGPISGPDVMPRHTWIASSGVAGEPISIGGRVRNCGDVDVTVVTTLRFWLSSNQTLESSQDILLHSALISPLGNRNDPCSENLSPVISQMATLPCVEPGTYYLLIQADANQQLSQSSNYTPDIVAKRTQIRRRSTDLFPSNQSPGPGNTWAACPQDFIKGLVTVNSTGGCTNETVLDVWLSDSPTLSSGSYQALVGTTTVPGIPGGGSVVVDPWIEIPYNAPTNTLLHIVYEVDAANDVVEFNEFNNLASGPIFIDFCNKLGKDNGLSDIVPSNEIFGLSAYPNPVMNELNISYQPSLSEVANVELWSITGQPIHSRQLLPAEQSGKLSLDMANLPMGSYLLKVQIGEQSEVRKVFKR